MQKITHSNFHKITHAHPNKVQLGLSEERKVREAIRSPKVFPKGIKAISVSIFHRVLSISLSYLNSIEPQPGSKIHKDKQVSVELEPETMTALTQIEERRDYYQTCINGGY